MSAIIDQHKSEIEAFCRKNGIQYLGLFGSHARNEETSKSDIDLLVEFDDKVCLSLMDIVSIEQDLSDILQTTVDLVEKRALHKQIIPYVMENLQNIYGQQPS